LVLLALGNAFYQLLNGFGLIARGHVLAGEFEIHWCKIRMDFGMIYR
jgi:hypothetical protein